LLFVVSLVFHQHFNVLTSSLSPWSLTTDVLGKFQVQNRAKGQEDRLTEARTAIGHLRAALASTLDCCPMELLATGTREQHNDGSFTCEALDLCRHCASEQHDTRACPDGDHSPPETCRFCFLPQTLCQERLHDPEKEFGTAACPWWLLTLAVRRMWQRGRLNNTPQTGVTRGMSFRKAMDQLWLVPAAGDLLPPGVRVIVDAHNRNVGRA